MQTFSKWLAMSAVMLAVPVLAADVEADSPIQVTYKVLRAPNDALLAGDLGVRPGRTAMVERKVARTSERQQLTLDLSPMVRNGAYAVRVGWTDSNAEGESVEWTPTAIARPGAPVELKISFPGGSRTLSLLITDPKG